MAKLRDQFQRRHHWWAMVRKRWPWAIWIGGNGPFAVLAYCRQLSISLHPNRDHAEADMKVIDRAGCGGGCHRDHRIVDLRKQLSEVADLRERVRRWGFRGD